MAAIEEAVLGDPLGGPSAKRSARDHARCTLPDAGTRDDPPSRRARAGVLGQSRPGLRLHGRGARAAPGAGGRGDAASSRSRPSCRSRGAARTSACGRSSGCTRRTASRSRIRSEIPLSGGLGSSAAAIVAGLMAADHLFELRRRPARAGERAGGHPDNVAAALRGGFVICADGAGARASSPRPVWRRSRSYRRSRCARARRARRCRRRSRSGRPSSTSPTPPLLTLGLARGDWDLVARGSARPPAPAAPRAPVPALL